MAAPADAFYWVAACLKPTYFATPPPEFPVVVKVTALTDDEPTWWAMNPPTAAKVLEHLRPLTDRVTVEVVGAHRTVP